MRQHGRSRLLRGNEPIALAPAKTLSNGRLVLTPSLPLDPMTQYTIIVDGIEDSGGNRLSAPVTIGFTTGEQFDADGPSVSLRAQPRMLRLVFSEPIDVTSALAIPALLTSIDQHDETRYARVEPITVDWSEDRRELRIVPSNAFMPGRQYSVHTGNLVDLTGVGAKSSSLQFVPSADPAPEPTRVAIYPADGSNSVPLNVIMLVHFSRAVEMPVVRLYEDDRQVTATAPQTSSIALLQRPLKSASRYRITVDSFRHEYDNEIASVSSSFTTGEANDRVLLQFVSSSPANGETGVAPETPWELTFSEPLAPVFSLPFGPRASGGMPFRTTTATLGSQLTIRAIPAWPAASLIELTLLPGPPLADWAGNRLNQQRTLNFRTAAINDPVPPVLESVAPSSGTTVPGNRARVELRFSKPVAIGAGVQVFYGSQRVEVNGIYSEDFRTVTYNLRPPPNSRVTLIGTDAIRDSAGNSISPFVLEYPTGDNLPSGDPVAELAEPRGAETYPPAATILIRFDRVMRPDSVVNAIRVTENGNNTAGSIETLEGGRAYRFRPNALFPAGAAVRVFLLPTAEDTEGRPVYRSHDSIALGGFTIAGGARTLSVQATGFEGGAPADSVLEVEFNGELDASTIGADSVWLSSGGGAGSGLRFAARWTRSALHAECAIEARRRVRIDRRRRFTRTRWRCLPRTGHAIHRRPDRGTSGS